MNRTAAFVALMLACLPVATRAEPLVVFAASSLKEPLDQIAADFGDVSVSYGGSGAMARQVTLGAPADVVVLAHPVWITTLTEAAAIEADTLHDIASNALVIVSQTAQALPLTAEGLHAALGDGRLALGLTNAVPAGIYAKESLINSGLWADVESQLAEVENVRVALTLVLRGEAPLGIVYASDARIAPTLHTVATLPTSSHSPIRYQAAVVAGARHPDAAAFVTHLTTPEAQSILAASGFLPPVGLP